MGKILISRQEFLRISSILLSGTIYEGNVFRQSPYMMSGKRLLGKTGISVSRLCISCPLVNDMALIKHAMLKGINFIDTARSYGNGNNELLVGQAVAGFRKDIIIQTKIRPGQDQISHLFNMGRRGSDIKKILTINLKASLDALQTDYLDVLLFHDATDEKILFNPETLEFFSEAKRKGLIRAHGFSTHMEYMNLIEWNNKLGFYDIIMIPFFDTASLRSAKPATNLFPEDERSASILKTAFGNGMGIIAMNPFRGSQKRISGIPIPVKKEMVKWILDNDFIGSAAIPFSAFEEIDEITGIMRQY